MHTQYPTFNLMKTKFLLLVTSLILLSFDVKADQLALISLSQAKKAVEFLKSQEEVVLWCACCDNEEKLLVRIKSVYFKPAGKDLYQVMLNCVDKQGNLMEEALDLAYVHVRNSQQGYCLGNVLGMECDPCTEPFWWR